MVRMIETGGRGGVSLDLLGGRNVLLGLHSGITLVSEQLDKEIQVKCMCVCVECEIQSNNRSAFLYAEEV